MTMKLLSLATTALVGLTLTGTAPAFADGGRNVGFHCHGKNFCHGKRFGNGRRDDDFRFRGRGDRFRFDNYGRNYRY